MEFTVKVYSIDHKFIRILFFLSHAATLMTLEDIEVKEVETKKNPVPEADD